MAQIGLRESAGRTRAAAAFVRIIESGKLLLGIINDILDFSRIEAGKLGIEALPYDPGEVVDRSADLLAERAGEKGIALRIEKSAALPRRCVGDPLRVQQVLVNLLSNAVKFTDAGEVVLSAERDQGQLVLRVRDTGIGLSEDQIARIFNPFEQADGSMTRRYGGSGLGLAISRRLAELMHGEIRVASQPGAGSRFELRLPLVEAEEASPAVPAAPAAGGSHSLEGLRLLVAEDSDINRAVLEELLAAEGAEVVLKEDGAQAVIEVQRAGASAYDLVLMDVQMPVMDGYAATRRIRELAPELPVVGQTAHALAEDRARCLAAGMVDHIAKPADIAELVAVIRRHARRRPRNAARPAVMAGSGG
jgi:CheY-like chemotaxis protein/anti-sigma regulatory factor (Ser/Thr protein kinase)